MNIIWRLKLSLVRETAGVPLCLFKKFLVDHYRQH